MREALVIAAKDLRLRLRDRSAIVVAFVAPVALASIVGLALGGQEDVFRATFGVADRDGGDIARAFTDVLRSPELRGTVRVVPVDDPDSGDTEVAFVIPQGFTESVRGGGEAHVEVVSPRGSFEGLIARAIADAFVAQLNASRLSIVTAANAGGQLETGRIPELAARVAAERIPVRLRDMPAGIRVVRTVNYSGPAMAIFFLFFTVQFGARGLLAERREGTMARLRAAPIRPWSILAGKAVAMFVMALASFATMFAVLGTLFGVSWGDPVALAALVGVTVLAAMGISSLVATLARTDEQAGAYSSMTAVLLALLGGNFVPLFSLPEVLQRLTLVTPNGWALRGFTDLVFDGAGLGAVAPNVAAIAAFAAVTCSVALLRARRVVTGT